MTTPTAADNWISALRQAHDQLADLVRRLDADDLARQSACSDWDVAQALGHLGSGSEIAVATLVAALDGADGPGSDFNQPVWDRWNGLDNAAKAAGFLERGEALVARYEALDAATRADLRIKLPFFPEPVDVATLVRLRTSEITHHGWDVRVAFDPTATLHPAAVDLMIDHSGDFLAYIGKADRLAGRPATLAVETTDPPRSYGLTIADAVSLDHRRAAGPGRDPPPPGRVLAPPDLRPSPPRAHPRGRSPSPATGPPSTTSAASSPASEPSSAKPPLGDRPFSWLIPLEVRREMSGSGRPPMAPTRRAALDRGPRLASAPAPAGPARLGTSQPAADRRRPGAVRVRWPSRKWIPPLRLLMAGAGVGAGGGGGCGRRRPGGRSRRR